MPDYGLLLGLTLAVFAFRLLYIVFWHPYGLAPDEAQYWSWLAHNDWSFLTKPPLTTWLMGVSTLVFGQTLLGVKFFALVGQAATAVLGFLLANEVMGRRAGWWAWLLLTTVPLIAAGGFIMCPDAVLVPLWMAALLAVVRGVGKPELQALCWPRWVIVGVLVGLGGLAKYSAALFFPLLGIYLLVAKREWLKRPQIWGSGVIALAFQLPVLVWNAQNHWVGVEHVLWQADGGGKAHSVLQGVGEFLGGQALVLGPMVFLLGAWAVWRMARRYRSPKVDFLLWMSVSILGMFLLLSFTSKVQANWPVLGAVGAIVVLAVWLGRAKRREMAALAVVGVLLNVFVSGVLMDTYKARDIHLMPLKAKNDPTKDLRGWADMGQMLGLMLYKLDNPVVLSSRYQTLAPLMFHTVGNPEFAYINAEARRLNEYDLWPLPDLADRLVVYVNEQPVLPPKIRGMFTQCEPWHNLATEEYGQQVRRLNLWICWAGKTTG